MEEEVDKTFIHVELIEEALPYLVKGTSLLTHKTVIGFPYIYMEKKDDGEVSFANCIIAPQYADDLGLDIEGFDIAFKRGEFHPIEGKLYKFVKMSDDNTALFEDDIND